MHPTIERGEHLTGIVPWLGPLAFALEIFGIGAIVVSVIVATPRYIHDLWHRLGDIAYQTYRTNLGRGILIGLEILIGADITAMITSPFTWESVGLLGFIILIRTFLSISLGCELEGEWPWKRRQREWQERSSQRQKGDTV